MLAAFGSRSRAPEASRASIKTGFTDLGKSLALEPEVKHVETTEHYDIGKEKSEGWSVSVPISIPS